MQGCPSADLADIMEHATRHLPGSKKSAEVLYLTAVMTPGAFERWQDELMAPSAISSPGHLQGFLHGKRHRTVEVCTLLSSVPPQAVAISPSCPSYQLECLDVPAFCLF